jgi:hypothetical protein
MSIADKSLTIDVWGGAISLSLIQGESAGRKIYVTIMDEGDPIDLTGREVRLYVVKPDATVVYTNCDIDDAEQGKVSFVVSSQMVAVSGLGSGEFHVIDADGALLKTPKIGIVIQPSLDVDGAIESSNEYSVLVDLINAQERIGQYHALCNASLCQGGMTTIAQAPPNTTTFQYVDFPKTYSQPPSVVATCAMQSPHYYQISVIGVTTARFRLAVRNVYSSAVDVKVRWIAVGE